MSADAYLLVVPAPCDWLRSNGGHGNRYARAEQIKTWRQAAAWSARAARIPRIDVPVHITATVHLDTRPGAHWDAANWLPTAKACVDGLVLHPKHGGADVLRDDCNCWVTGPDMRPGARVADARLALTIRLLREAS